MDILKLNKEFSNKGYIIIRDFFDEEARKRCESSIVKMFALQASKIKPYKERMSKPYYEYESYDDICEVYDMMESQDKEALYQVHNMLSEHPNVRDFVNNLDLIELAAELINVDKEIALLSGMGLFINKPGTNRLLYKWHTAEHGYPKRRKCLSVWFPLFIEKTEENGVMYVAEGSHKKQFPFVEYTGYNSGDKGKVNQLTQREIPVELLKEYKKVPTIVKPGDVVLFDHSFVHTSSINESNDISFAGVIKVWDPSSDYTLSGSIAATPYGNDFGRPELIVHP
jgi:ectoine hydroxylase-related dioxygenase (phytanoyl-CoA dioxygenase family)